MLLHSFECLSEMRCAVCLQEGGGSTGSQRRAAKSSAQRRSEAVDAAVTIETSVKLFIVLVLNYML